MRDGIATAESVQTYATATVPTDSFVLPDALTPAQTDAVERRDRPGSATGWSSCGSGRCDGSLIYSSADAHRDRRSPTATGSTWSPRAATPTRG